MSKALKMQLADLPNVAVYACRHGATSLNLDNCFRGNANPPLAPEGLRDARTLSRLFDPIEISAIFTSDKQRAVQTAETIAKPHNLRIHSSHNLRALNIGDFSGKQRTPENEKALEQYINSPDTPIPGGESLNDFKSRIRPCIQDAIDLYLECGVPPLIVAHSSVVHEIGAMVYGDHKSILVQPGGAVAIYFEGGQVKAAPILKPVKSAPHGASTVS